MSTPQGQEPEVPLLSQRFFGAGIKRKRIQFVPSASTPESNSSLPPAPSSTVADRYRALVLKDEKKPPPPPLSAPGDSIKAADNTLEQDGTAGVDAGARCEICRHPVSAADSATSHDLSIVHQICLQHSHPPSHLDRKRKGLAVLESQGWDPDSRRGLGADGAGILHPVKARENPTRAGLGAKQEVTQKVQKPVKLDAGKVRLREREGKKKAERLHNAFYRSENVLKYLGE